MADFEGIMVSDLVVRYGSVLALDHVDLVIPRSGVLGIIGPNGAGKSTLLGVIGGQTRPNAGTVAVGNVDITSWSPSRRAKSGIIRTFQLSSQFDRLTVVENLLLGVRRHGGESLNPFRRRGWKRDESRYLHEALEMLDRLGLSDKADEYAGTLSGGQKRLLEISRALMAQPAVLLLDEPIAGVSPAVIPRVEDCILDAAAASISVVIVEHELSVVARVCDEVVMMARGGVLAQGRLEELQAQKEVLDAYLVG